MFHLVISFRAKLIKCKNLTDEKVALATQAYEWIERSIAALDSELKKFEAELSEKKKHGTTLPQKKKMFFFFAYILIPFTHFLAVLFSFTLLFN